MLSWIKKRSKKPVIHLYTICWNEEKTLDFFFQHYDGIVDRYVFYDDGSTDRTLEILNKHPKVEVRSLPRLATDSYVLAAKGVHNSCWKESRGVADWVIFTAVDEFLYHPFLLSYIKLCDWRGVTAIPALGYQMISDFFPKLEEKLTRQIQFGAPYFFMNKLSLFKPDQIENSGFEEGRHKAKPTGNVVYPKVDRMLILHYKYLSFDHTLKRHQELNEKLGRYDKKQNWGIQYSWDKAKLQKEWDEFKTHAVQVRRGFFNANKTHSSLEERWWRKG
jgi:glycosyltransferase involved in cell wall biosynthesis